MVTDSGVADLSGEGVPQPGSYPGEGSVHKSAEVGFMGGEETGRGGSQGPWGLVGGEEVSEIFKTMEGCEGEDQDYDGNPVKFF